MVLSAIKATVATLILVVKLCIDKVAISTHAFTISIALSIQPFVRSVLGHGRGKHYGYQ